jgi:hypothetical protein
MAPCAVDPRGTRSEGEAECASSLLRAGVRQHVACRPDLPPPPGGMRHRAAKDAGGASLAGIGQDVDSLPTSVCHARIRFGVLHRRSVRAAATVASGAVQNASGPDERERLKVQLCLMSDELEPRAEAAWAAPASSTGAASAPIVLSDAATARLLRRRQGVVPGGFASNGARSCATTPKRHERRLLNRKMRARDVAARCGARGGYVAAGQLF